MRSRVAIVLCAIGAVAVGPEASADAQPVAQAHAALLSGDYVGAERLLLAEQRIYPRRPEVLLNLAALYASTGRRDEALRLYRSVLAQSDTAMDLSAERTASAHAIARTGLDRLNRVVTAAR